MAVPVCASVWHWLAFADDDEQRAVAVAVATARCSVGLFLKKF